MDNKKEKKPEAMADFFNARAGLYDNHMKETVESFDGFYETVASCIAETGARISILDIGCGTGLELKRIFKRAPNAVVTAVDISSEMLDRLLDKFKEYRQQIVPVRKSYLDFRFKEKQYDYVMAVYTLHHLPPDSRRAVYRKIPGSLKPGGMFIEGDYVVSGEEEQERLSEYRRIADNNDTVTDGSHHIDIPMSLETQKRLLADAGFSKIEVIWDKSRAAILTAAVPCS